ncbi:hypothetical protein [Chryseobacterium gleum]|uniref:hypothetical protein n=1 Tax=Chryseobacterium gleum TaxID=250 RepID=UPI0028ADA260|nr:hypothetical protein [Chryseobacterium gleum]
MKNVLKHKHTKRVFLSLFGVSFLAIALIQIFLIPYLESQKINENFLYYIKRLFDSFLISFFISIIIALFTNYFEIPDEDKKIEILEPYKSNEKFKNAYGTISFWYFSGGLGRYNRDKTLNAFNTKSKNTNTHLSLKFLILDPRDNSVCSLYAKYRNSLSSSESNSFKWDEYNVKLELLATVIIAAIIGSGNNLLNIDLRVKKNFNTIRLDINDNEIFITKEDKREASIYSKKETYIYRTFFEDFLQTFKSSEKIEIEIESKYNINTLTIEDLKSILKKLNLEYLAFEPEYPLLLKKIKRNDNPY